MRPINSCSRMCFEVSTDTRLDMSQSFITCVVVFFDWVSAVLILFCIILCRSFRGQPYLGRSKTLPLPWNLTKISKMPLLEIPSFLAHWFIFLVVYTIFVFISLEIFAMILDVIIFTIFKKKIGTIAENDLHINDGTFSVLKHCILIDLFVMAKNVWRGSALVSFSDNKNPYAKHPFINRRNLQ